MQEEGQSLPELTDIHQLPHGVTTSQGQRRGTFQSQTLRIPLSTLSLSITLLKRSAPAAHKASTSIFLFVDHAVNVSPE